MNHLIHRQIFDLHFETVTQAQAGQQQIAQLWQERLLPIADAVFSEIAAGETIRLDTLEIDLGNLSSTDLDEWADIWREKLTLALQSAWAKPENPSKKRFSDLDGLIFFLQTGTTAWWITAKQDFNPVEMLERLILKQSESLRQALKSLVFDSQRIERLLHQFPTETLEKLSILLTTNSKSAFYILDFFEILINDWSNETLDATLSQSVLKPIPGSKTVKGQLTELLWTAILSKSEQEEIPFLIKTIGRTFFNETTPIYIGVALEQRFLKMATSGRITGFPTEIWVLIKKTLGISEWGMRNVALQVSESMDNPPIPQSAIHNSPTTEHPMMPQSAMDNPQSIENQHIPQSAIPIPQSDCFIENAGLILIAPFFKTFFNNLDLLDKNAFKNKAAQQKAILITQYLATSKLQVFENQLIMNKLLCGYALSESLPTDLLLTENDKKECLELLETVKSHWKALKNTRIETLQARFLNRKGKLQPKENHWSLTVERETIDILFEATPLNWNFSYVKLPWMAQPIFTAW